MASRTGISSAGIRMQTENSSAWAGADGRKPFRRNCRLQTSKMGSRSGSWFTLCQPGHWHPVVKHRAKAGKVATSFRIGAATKSSHFETTNQLIYSNTCYIIVIWIRPFGDDFNCIDRKFQSQWALHNSSRCFVSHGKFWTVNALFSPPVCSGMHNPMVCGWYIPLSLYNLSRYCGRLWFLLLKSQ